MNKTYLWNELHDLFDTDDGSLPEIEIANLNAPQIGAIYSYLLSSGKDVTLGGGMFWDRDLDRDRYINEVENAALLVTKNIADPFHILVGGIEHDETIIPDLGVFIWDDSITLDYRMGSEWGPAELEALFYHLSRIKKIAPEMEISIYTGIMNISK